MPADLSSLLRFYRDAYRHEYRTEKVTNFFAKAVSHKYYPATFKLLGQTGYQLPVATEWGREAAKYLTLTSSERKLVLGAFFLKGKQRLLGKTRTAFAPLFLLDVSLTEYDEAYLIEADASSLVVNPAALELMNKLAADRAGLAEDEAEVLIHEDGPFNFTGLHHLKEQLSQHFPALNVSSLDERMATDARLSDLAKVAQSRSEKYEGVLYADTALGVVDRPVKSKGVINELGVLSERTLPAGSLLHQLFGLGEAGTNKIAVQGGAQELAVPVTLSAKQRGILSAVRDRPMNLVVGPPGTGKSFTIAALAIQMAYEGKTVLIASKNEQACRVIYEKIQTDIGVKGIALDASRARFRGTVATKLRHLYSGVGFKAHEKRTYRQQRQYVRDLQQQLDQLTEELLDRERQETKWGERLAEGGTGIVDRLRVRWIAFQVKRNRPLWEIQRDIHKKAVALKKKQRRLLRMTYENRVSNLMSKHRKEAADLEKAYRQGHGNVAKEIFAQADYDIVLGALPIWICKSADLNDVLPLRNELFDLVILDEASQCDLASSLPLLYRAKTAAIVGDPHQLRHVSFISKNREAALRKKHGITDAGVTFRDRSVLDQLNQSLRAQASVHFLDEHYRSMPDIIHFSNTQFYDGALKVMTANPTTEARQHLFTHHVSGIRDEKGVNEEEAAHLLEEVQRLVTEEARLDKQVVTSIGIISPFRAQVNHIQHEVRGLFTYHQIQRHRIVVGTPFTFQGEERDRVYLTFVVDADTHPSAYRYLERPDVFNVSITRAKLEQHVYHSVPTKQLPPAGLLTKYLSTRYTPADTAQAIQLYDAFAEEVTTYVRQINTGNILHNRVISGCLLDILLITPGRVFAIDLVGYPGQFSAQLSVESIQILERAGVAVFMLPYSSWLFERGACERVLRGWVG